MRQRQKASKPVRRYGRAREDKTRERLLAGALAAVLVMAVAALSLMRSPEPDTQTTTPQETAAAGVGNGDSASAENPATGTGGDAAALATVAAALIGEPLMRPYYRLDFFKETDSQPGLSQPHSNETYIQLFVGAQGEAEAYVEALRRHSYRAIAAPATGDAGLDRVLVGPVADGAVENLLNDLQKRGLPADPALVVKL